MDNNLLSTESVNPVSMNIDTKTTLEICTLMNDEDKTVAHAVAHALPIVSALVDDIVDSFRRNGRLVYIGAGTSGRLGVLDASECPPTFGVSPTMVIGLIAGGDIALRNAVERAEDNGAAGIDDLKKINFSNNDTLVGITASGQASYVLEAMKYAKQLGAVVGAISCNEQSSTFAVAKHCIYLPVGPEIITGSTRLKSGTAQKMTLNMLTTVSMIKLGYVYNNYIVNLIPTNKKLESRAKDLIQKIAQCSKERAEDIWKECKGNTSAGILMQLYKISYQEAISCLTAAKNNLHNAMGLCEDEKESSII